MAADSARIGAEQDTAPQRAAQVEPQAAAGAAGVAGAAEAVAPLGHVEATTLGGLSAGPPRPGRGFDASRAGLLLRAQQSLGNSVVQRLMQRGQAATTPADQEDLPARLRAAGGGQVLPPQVQTQLAHGLGRDVSSVRVHADGAADQLARDVDAVAFTTGQDVFFRAGAYDPNSPDGMQLLAHEAVHVLQQAAGPVAGTPAPGGVAISDPGDPYEHAAEQAAAPLASPVPQAPIGPGPEPASGQGARGDGVTFAGVPAAAPPQPEVAPAAGATTQRQVQRQVPAAAPAAPAAPATPATTPDPSGGTPAGPGAFTGQFNVDWVQMTITGAVEPQRPRTTGVCYIGDTVSVIGTVGGVPTPARTAGLHTTAMGVGVSGNAGQMEIRGRWLNDNAYVWDIIPSQPGRQSFQFSISDSAFENEQNYNLDLTAAANVSYFKGRASTAESTLNTLHARGRVWFDSCFKNYKKAYDAHNAALKAQAGADKLVGDLLFGVIFAAVGGAAGGAIGGAMADMQIAGQTLKASFGSVGSGALTDAAKDLGKYVARIPAGQLAGAAATPAPGAGGGTTPTTTDPAQAGVGGRGAGAPAAVDPLDWMTAIDGAIAAERAAAGAQVTAAHNAADNAAVFHPEYQFDWDPVEVVTQGAKIDGKPIDNLGAVPSDLAYERSFWEVWLSNYAWKAHTWSDDLFSGRGASVDRNVGGKLHDEIERVASRFGETADQWIERYGAASRRAAQAQANAWAPGSAP